jgi:hypothetical protein
VHEAVLRDGDVVVFGGGGNRPIGAIFEQRESEFKYEFRASPWSPLLLSADDESEEDDNTVDGEAELERNAEDTQDVGIFDMDTAMPSSSITITAPTSSMAATPTIDSQLSGEEASPYTKKRKRLPSPSTDSVEDAELTATATLPMTGSETMPLAETVEWPVGPDPKRPCRGAASHAFSDSLELAPELSNDSTLQTETELVRRKRAVLSLPREKEASERETIEANIADVEARLAEPINDDEAEKRLMKLQADLFAACEHRKMLKPMYPVPADSPLHCKFCENMMFNPTVMGCGHSLCDGCVECLVIEKPECPVCALPISLPIQPNTELQNELMVAVREWTPEQRQEWVNKMTRRNEAARTAELELMLESVRVRGIRFLQITERWKDHDRNTFAEGIDIYSSSSRLAFCRAVGLTPEWIATADMNQLIVALGNLGIPLTPLVNRTKHVDGVRPLPNILDAFREGLTYFIHHNRRHIAQQQHHQQQQLQQQLQQAQQQAQQLQHALLPAQLQLADQAGLAQVQVNLAAPHHQNPDQVGHRDLHRQAPR